MPNGNIPASSSEVNSEFNKFISNYTIPGMNIQLSKSPLNNQIPINSGGREILSIYTSIFSRVKRKLLSLLGNQNNSVNIISIRQKIAPDLEKLQRLKPEVRQILSAAKIGGSRRSRRKASRKNSTRRRR